jgi:hypothetical protein
MPSQPDNPEIQRRARRVLWACGLCFGLLFLMGLTGVASITLLYDDPMMRTNMRGFEGSVVRFVASLEDVIDVIHSWGGYAGIVLSGWAGLEVFSFARLLRRTDKAEWRTSGRRLAPLGLAGAVLLIGALLVLIPTGVAAKGYLGSDEPAVVDEMPNPDRQPPRVPGVVELEDAGDSEMADWHLRQLNFLLAIGAFLLMFAVSSTRRIQLQARKEAPPKADA